MKSDLRPDFYSISIDDIFAVFKDSDYVKLFLDFINSIHRNINFPVENAEETFPFLNPYI